MPANLPDVYEREVSGSISVCIILLTPKVAPRNAWQEQHDTLEASALDGGLCEPDKGVYGVGAFAILNRDKIKHNTCYRT